MKYQLFKTLPTQEQEMLVLFCWAKDPKQTLPTIFKRDAHLQLLWSRTLGDEHHRGGLFELAYIPAPSENLKRLLIVGLGEQKKLTLRDWEHTMSLVASSICQRRATSATIVLPKLDFKNIDSARATFKGVELGRYQFLQYKKASDDKPKQLERLGFVNWQGGEKLWKDMMQEQEILGELTQQVRHWGNTPANVCTPTYMAKEAVRLGKNSPKLSIKYFNKEQIKKLGMGALWGVSKGSREHPAFIVMEYWGAEKNLKPLVFVGKGITFDSGGISLKPGKGMEEMKFDMAGAAAVIGALNAIARLKLKVNVIGLAPCSENLPGGEAYKPGDVLTAMDGTTMEITNTDAEGRVILSDALSYAHRYQPSAVIDLATLTGAALVVLAHEGTPMVGNNQAVLDMVQTAASRTNDRVWPLPLWDEFEEDIKSDVADVKNGGAGYGGGVITGAMFLKHFIKDLPWTHLDIAGTAWFTSPKPWMAKGATGVGVHLLVEVAKLWKPIKK